MKSLKASKTNESGHVVIDGEADAADWRADGDTKTRITKEF